MATIDPKQSELREVYLHLVGSVGPRPIAFASTVDIEGRPNLAPFSFFNVFSPRPPMLVFSPTRRGRDGTSKDTYENVKVHPEVVVNVVTYEMVQQTNLASTEYARGVNEFKKAGFTAQPSERVKPARVKESPVQFECKVREVIELGDAGGAGNLVVAEVVLMHIADEVLGDNKQVDPQKIRLVGRMGGPYYSKAFGNAVFEVPRPIKKLGIGVDNMPAAVRESTVLTGNDLGKLGNVEALPPEAAVAQAQKMPEVAAIQKEYAADPKALQDALHRLAHELLEVDKVEVAWKVLMIALQ